jgi:hypothetical protein
MNWTHDIPNEDGYYWYKYEGGGCKDIIQIIWENRNGKTTWWVEYGDQYSTLKELCKDGDVLFAGPIPEPKD